MNLERTTQLIHIGINNDAPVESLIHVLEAAIELVSLPDNDFSWSFWEDGQAALSEINGLINSLKVGILPDKVSVAVLFVPTGPLQEVSLSNGWGNAFLKVAEKYDEVEKLLWK